MDYERAAKEYLRLKEYHATVAEQLAAYQKLLKQAIEAEGYEDDKGHRRFQAGNWALQLQKRQGAPRLDRAAAEEWLAEMDEEDQARITSVTLDEDKLAAWAYENRKDPIIRSRYKKLFITPEPTYAFMPPTENKYDDY